MMKKKREICWQNTKDTNKGVFFFLSIKEICLDLLDLLATLRNYGIIAKHCTLISWSSSSFSWLCQRRAQCSETRQTKSYWDSILLIQFCVDVCMVFSTTFYLFPAAETSLPNCFVLRCEKWKTCIQPHTLYTTQHISCAHTLTHRESIHTNHKT